MVLKKLIEVRKESTDSASGRNTDPMGLWQWALQYGCQAYFEVKFDF